MTDKEKVENFLEEYKELCFKYGLHIQHMKPLHLSYRYDHDPVKYAAKCEEGHVLADIKEIKENLTLAKLFGFGEGND